MKPILFNTDMVRAILDGRKTVTRRVMKPQPLFYTGRRYVFADDTCPKKWENCHDIISTYQYQPGDILYVPEPWRCMGMFGDTGYIVGFKDGQTVRFNFEEKSRAEKWAKYGNKPFEHWQSPYFMPREAARIFLRVTDVRVERVQDITFEQIKSEGISENDIMERDALHQDGSARWLYERLWDSTIKPADRALYGWDANPYVWTIEFERISKNEAMQ